MAADEVVKQLPIGQPSIVTQENRFAKLLNDFAHLAGRHVLSFVPQLPPTLLLPARGNLIAIFFRRNSEGFAEFCQFAPLLGRTIALRTQVLPRSA
jgi:hypothetical protein